MSTSLKVMKHPASAAYDIRANESNDISKTSTLPSGTREFHMVSGRQVMAVEPTWGCSR